MFESIRKLTQHTLVYGAGHILTRALGFILLPLFTHTLTQEDFGTLSLLFSYIAALTILYGFGIDSAFFRYYVLAETGAERQRIFSAAYWLVAGIIAVFSLAQWLWAEPLTVLLLGHGTHTPLLLMGVIILACDALAAFPFLLFRAEERSHFFAINKLVNVALNVGLSYIFLIKLQRGLNGVLEANLLASAFTFITLLPVSVKRLHFEIPRAVCAKLARYGLPYLPSTLGIVAIDNMDRYILNALTDLKTVGLYSAGYRLGIVMGLLIAAFRFAWMPFSLNVSRAENARALYARVLTYFITVCAAFFLLISFFIDDLVRRHLGTFTLIAPEYWPATVIVPIILLGYLCYGVFVNLLVGIHLEEKTQYLPLLTGLGVIVNAALNFLLIPQYGMLGAAWATAIAYAAMVVCGYFVAQKIYPVAYEWRRIVIVSLVTAALFFIHQLLPLHIAVRAALLLSFPLLLFVCGFFEKSELTRFKKNSGSFVKASKVTKKILFVAYYFPPMGMGGTQRVAKWSKYLARLGWQVSVVTVKPVLYYAQDESLLEELREVRILRAGSLDPARVFHLLKKRNAPSQAAQRGLGNLLYWFLLPDARILWVPFAAWRAWREIRKHKIPFVLTSGPPHSAHLVGWLLSRFLQVQWLADFRDTWLLDERTQAPTRLHRFLQRKLERLVVRKAHLLTAVSQGLLHLLQEKGARATNTCFYLPNGYDPEDFPPAPQEKRTRFELTFVGSITSYTIPKTFLAGFKHFIDTAQLSPQEVRLNFVGADLTGKFLEWIKENGLEDFLNWRGYVSHAEALASFRAADVLLYLVTAGVADTIIPSKTFEYLAARKPVLAVGEQIEGMRLLLENAACRYCAFEPVDDIARSLLAFYAEFHRGELPAAPAQARQFSRAAQAEQLAQVLLRASGRDEAL